jgi:hypothetical protein
MATGGDLVMILRFVSVVFTLHKQCKFVFLLQQITDKLGNIAQNLLLLRNEWHTMQICLGGLYKK